VDAGGADIVKIVMVVGVGDGGKGGWRGLVVAMIITIVMMEVVCRR
jgi:hypothetical protein